MKKHSEDQDFLLSTCLLKPFVLFVPADCSRNKDSQQILERNVNAFITGRESGCKASCCHELATKG